MKKNQISRRKFIKKSAGAALGLISAPYFIPSNVLGLNNAISPSNKITLGCIGIGWQGGSNLQAFLGEKDAQVVALCDIDKKHLEEARQKVELSYGKSDLALYHDFREILDRKDIDAVVISTPDHWHAIPAVEAAKAGKDIFCEKPLSHTFAEGRIMADAVKRYGSIWQTGSWQRSIPNFRFACELVRNGRIGKVHTVEIGLPAGHADFEGTKGQEAPMTPPEALDYNRWLGPAPYAPYAPARVHKNWRWNLAYGGGQLMDWIGHHCDIAHWGLDLDKTGPIEVEGVGEYPKTGLWNTATKYRVDAKYSGDLKFIIAGGHNDVCEGRSGTKWIGENGWVFVGRGEIDASDKSLLTEKLDPGETHLYRSPGHMREFLDCIKSRTETITPCETAHRSATPGHLGQIAMLTGHKLKFDPVTEKILNDDTASKMLSRSYRSPWHL
ncbi:MAG: Gfo/Idh/MocA family oxidoreductase [Melioribacteraceae bacterium]|nr:Gfo/Idh/MocA family oxidoreductase [Melioribacteraceae bacterium]